MGVWKRDEWGADDDGQHRSRECHWVWVFRQLLGTTIVERRLGTGGTRLWVSWQGSKVKVKGKGKECINKQRNQFENKT